MTNSKPLLNIVQDIMYLLTLNGNTSEYQTKAKELNPDELQVLKTIKAKQAKTQHKTKSKQNKPVKNEVEHTEQPIKQTPSKKPHNSVKRQQPLNKCPSKPGFTIGTKQLTKHKNQKPATPQHYNISSDDDKDDDDDDDEDDDDDKVVIKNNSESDDDDEEDTFLKNFKDIVKGPIITKVLHEPIQPETETDDEASLEYLEVLTVVLANIHKHKISPGVKQHLTKQIEQIKAADEAMKKMKANPDLDENESNILVEIVKKGLEAKDGADITIAQLNRQSEPNYRHRRKTKKKKPKT